MGVGGSVLILGLSSWGSCSSLHLVGQCQVLPLPSEGIRTQPPVPSCLCWCGVLLLFTTALEELLFRDYLLNTPSGEQGSSQSLTTKIIGKGPYFPAASQLRTCTEWNVFLRE